MLPCSPGAIGKITAQSSATRRVRPWVLSVPERRLGGSYAGTARSTPSRTSLLCRPAERSPRTGSASTSRADSCATCRYAAWNEMCRHARIGHTRPAAARSCSGSQTQSTPFHIPIEHGLRDEAFQRLPFARLAKPVVLTRCSVRVRPSRWSTSPAPSAGCAPGPQPRGRPFVLYGLSLGAEAVLLTASYLPHLG